MKTHLSLRITALGLLLAVSLQAQSASTDPGGITNLATSPLITNTAGSINPNLFLILDDSASMAWDYLPENGVFFAGGSYGVASSQCNGVYYNPTITYTPPVLPNTIVLSSGTTTSGSNVITFTNTTPIVGGVPQPQPVAGEYVTGSGIPAGAYITTVNGATEVTLNKNATASASGVTFTIGSFPPVSFTAAPIIGFNPSQTTYRGFVSSPVNLSTSFVDANPYDRAPDSAQAAFYYSYSGTYTGAAQRDFNDPPPAVNPFWNECASSIGSAPGNAVFTKVVITPATTSYTGSLQRTDCANAPICSYAEESQNFANWFSYYRTRMMMMQSTTGLAFSSLSSNFNVGYSSINNNTGSDFLNLGQFTGVQKINWYNKFYSAVPNNATPLRESLTAIGKMYAGQTVPINGQTVVDPVQFSCQQNFTILTTDGDWNGGNTGSGTTQLDNATQIGEQDGNVARPQYDGSYILQTTSQTTESVIQNQQSTSNMTQWTEQDQYQQAYLQKQTGPLQWTTTQQQTAATLQWQSNLEQTNATLEWQSNLEQTNATLEWQTNLQQTLAPLQWKTNLQQTVQQQQWDTDLQITTAPLQWQTKQQMTTAPLLWSTTSQIATAALQYQTNLQATTATLQSQTSQLQSETSTLQSSTSTLQTQTTQLQSETSPLQTSTLYLMTRASTDGGSTWLPWQSATSCTWQTVNVDGALRQCEYVTASGGSTLWSAAAGTWTTVSSCTQSYDSTTASGGTPANGTVLTGNGTACQYQAWSSWAGVPSCTAVAQSSGNTTYATGVKCQSVVTSAWANASGTCTATTTPNSSGNTTQCQYTAWSAFSNLSSGTCTPAAQSTASPYTVTSATQCQYTAWSGWASASSCTSAPQSTSAPYSVLTAKQCQYTAYTAWANVVSGTCTAASQSSSSPYTQGVATNCQQINSSTAYVGYSGTTAPSCTVSSTSNASGIITTACANTGSTYSAWTNIPNNAACTNNAATGGSGSGTLHCQMASVAASYLAYGTTCTNTYNASGTSTANSSGQVTACTTNASFGPTTTLTGAQTCTSSATVTCAAGSGSTSYLSYPNTACSVSTIGSGGGVSTNNGVANSVVTACPVNASWSAATVLGSGQTCTGGGNVQCTTGTATTAYASSYAIASAGCSVSYNGTTGSSTTGTNNGVANTVITACGTAAYTTPVNIAACTASTYVQCPLSTTQTTSFVGTYPPQCVVNTNTGGLITTACTLNAGFSPATNVATGGTCAGGVQAAGSPTWGNTIQCVTGTGTASYVTYAAPTCTVSYNGTSGSSTAISGSINVVSACTTTGTTYGGTTSLTAGQTCTGGTSAAGSPTWGSTVNCPTTGASTAYVAYNTTGAATPSTPYCSQTWTSAAVGGTVNSSGKVVTACTTTGTTYGGTTSLTAGQTCTGGTYAAGATTWGSTVNCPTTGASTAYVAYGAGPSPITATTPYCSQTWTSATVGGTVNSSGKVVTACTTTGTTYGGTTSLTAGQNCTGGTYAAGATTWGSTVNCPTTGASTTYLTSYPPTCTVSYNGTSGSSTVLNSGSNSGKVVTCPINAAFNTTWTTATSPYTCTTSSTVNCRYNYGSWSNVSSGNTCTPTASGSYSGQTGTQCRYSGSVSDTTPTYTAWTNNLSATPCSTINPSSTSPYSVLTAQNCQVITPGTSPVSDTPVYVAVSSCTATAPNFNSSGQRISCNPVFNTTAVATCTPGTQTSSPYTVTTCPPAITITPAYGVASCTPGVGPGPNYYTTVCNTTSSAPTPNQFCTPTVASASNSWTNTTCSAPQGGSYDSLADVAQYFYITDLRTTTNNQFSLNPQSLGTDVSTNNVPPSSNDPATWQHMTTFTVGLGNVGRMVFDPNYQSEPAPSVSDPNPGDYSAVAYGATADGVSLCSWQAVGTTCNWPVPGNGLITNIDDLWHAAVDGRGTYFSATNPGELANGLNSAFVNINIRTGSAAAAAVSSAFITATNNYIYASNYATVEWSGQLWAQQIDPTTLDILPTIVWNAQPLLDQRNNTTRTVYTFDPTNSYNAGSTKLKAFIYTNLTAAQQAYFNLPSQATTLSQFCTVGAGCLGLAAESSASGAPLVNFLAGDRSNEGDLTTLQYFRVRTHLLGDIVDSQPAYVAQPPASFSDPGYSAFVAANASRTPMLYVGANDGMLHAFRAAANSAQPSIPAGNEDWAYIPALVLPNLYILADKNYSQLHQFFVDGSPTSGDICIANCTNSATAQWRTILVGGLNDGGYGYYALDITNPDSPKALWEFTSANMGKSYGDPRIVKLRNGTWVVLLSSGYDNTSGDGQGHLYVLNANTGALITDIPTGVGTPASPSGLARIDAPVTSPGFDATAIAAYGGDLEGNVWRFDINGADTEVPPRWTDIGAAGFDAQNLATLQDPSGNKQPITAKPLLTAVSGHLMVNIGTGRFLGLVDRNTTGQDSFYSIEDSFPSFDSSGNPINPAVSIYGNPRTYLTPAPGQYPFVHQTFTTFTCQTSTSSFCALGNGLVTPAGGAPVLQSSDLPVNLNQNPGWYFDFPLLGERDNTDPAISQGTLLIISNQPTIGSCSFGGNSYIYALDYTSGGAVSTMPDGIVQKQFAAALSSSGFVISTGFSQGPGSSGGSGVGIGMAGTGGTFEATLSNGLSGGTTIPPPGSSSGVARRVSWRELTVP